MKVYVVMRDDYEAGWPLAIFDKPDFAIEFAKRQKTQYLDLEVIEYDVNGIQENDRLEQIIYSTTKNWKLNHNES